MQIKDFRLTVVSTHSFLDRLKAVDRKQAWARLTDRFSYRVAYNMLRGEKLSLSDLHYPWRAEQKRRRRPVGRPSHFWLYYLGGKSPAEVSADVAWKYMVPFRLTWRPAMLTTDDVKDRVLYECYGFPHGLAITVTVQSRRTQRSLDEFVTRVRELGMDQVFTIGWEDGTSEGNLCVKTVVDRLLLEFRDRYYDQVSNVRLTPEPVSILTVVQGGEVDLEKPVDQALQRKLHAVTAWPQAWKNVELPLLDQGTLLPMKKQNKVPANCVYAQARGLTVWLPSLFTLESKPGAVGTLKQEPHYLSCLHHNLVAATVQAESLCAFAVLYADAAKEPHGLDGIDNEVASNVATQLAALYHGWDNTYRSWSLKALIKQAGCRTAINFLGDRPNNPKIAFET